MNRVAAPPRLCPTCNKPNRLTDTGQQGNTSVRLVGSRWHNYKLIDCGPAAGCGNCGHVVYLTKSPMLTCFYVDDHGTTEAA